MEEMKGERQCEWGRMRRNGGGQAELSRRRHRKILDHYNHSTFSIPWLKEDDSFLPLRDEASRRRVSNEITIQQETYRKLIGMG